MKRAAIKDVLSESAMAIIKENGISVTKKYNGRATTVKYSKAQHIEVFLGYDLLENFIVARPYIQKRYKIDLCLLELLLYLSPKQYFTMIDYRNMPKQFKYSTMKNLLNTGYISVLQAGSAMDKHLYCVNNKGSIIVRHFYEILSGEKKISEESFINPLALKRNTSTFDKKRMALIEKLNQSEVPESKRKLFTS